MKAKFKGGEKAQIVKNTARHPFHMGKIINVTKTYLDTEGIYYFCCDENGDCWYVNEIDLKKVNIKTMDKQMKKAVLDTANKLLKAQNTVTTLEIKADLIQNSPNFYWTQLFVSQTMDEYYMDGLFTFTDSGAYRIYSGSPANKATKTTLKVTTTTTYKPKATISRTKAYELITNNKGHFFTATFVKQNGEERTINCQFLKGKQDTLGLGYVKVKETGKLKTGVNPIRQINLQTLTTLKIQGNSYKIRK